MGKITGLFDNLHSVIGGMDAVWIIAILMLMVMILLITVIILLVKVNKLWIRYDLFMRGKDCETLEDNMVEIYHHLQMIRKDELMNKDLVVTMRRNVSNSIAKTGLVRYNAFPGMGGESSFAFTMLNMENSGYILNAIHSRESCYLYIREIHNGQPSETISEEEKASLEKALKVNIDRKKESVENL